MCNGMLNFEWAPEVEVADLWQENPYETLVIVNNVPLMRVMMQYENHAWMNMIILLKYKVLMIWERMHT